MTFYMTQFMFNSDKLVQFAKALHLPLRLTDNGYLIHCVLTEAFGKEATTVFSLESDGRQLRVLVYTNRDKNDLEMLCREYASPLVYSIFDWNKSQSKPMPAVFEKGTEYQFSIYACPIIRQSKDKKEVDAFLHEVWKVDKETEVDRNFIYKKWILGKLKKAGADCELEKINVESFQLLRLLRRNHEEKRSSKVIKRPAVLFNGRLIVEDPNLFQDRISRGIGRHKAFGFGMLKLRKVL